jgi:hypothetical protein
VRAPGSDLVGGAPEVNLTAGSFSEKHLRRLIHHRPGVPAATIASIPVERSRSASVQGGVTADAQVLVPAPVPVRVQGRLDLSASPPGGLTVTMKQAMAATGLGGTTVDELWNPGKLTRVKLGARALITTESIQKLLALATK